MRVTQDHEKGDRHPSIDVFRFPPVQEGNIDEEGERRGVGVNCSQKGTKGRENRIEGKRPVPRTAIE